MAKCHRTTNDALFDSWPGVGTADSDQDCALKEQLQGGCRGPESYTVLSLKRCVYLELIGRPVRLDPLAECGLALMVHYVVKSNTVYLS